MDSAAQDRREPLWFRIAWPCMKWTFFGLAGAALVLDAAIIVRSALRG